MVAGMDCQLAAQSAVDLVDQTGIAKDGCLAVPTAYFSAVVSASSTVVESAVSTVVMRVARRAMK